MQPQGHLQVIQALVDEGIDPQGALDRPRFQIADADPEGAVLFESESDPEVAAQLSEKGHDIRPISGRRRYVFGLGQIILRDEQGILWGGSDPRGDGCAQSAMV
jgi:gamma-glutamyltranspeptidase/glutathione hydrolase